MTDRSIRADTQAHARRTAPQADDARLAEIRAYAGFLSAIGPDTEGGRLGYLLARVDQLTAERDDSDEYVRRAMEQRRDMAEERFIWQERGDRAEATVERMKRTNRMVNGSAQEARERAEKAEAERDGYAARVPLICSDERHEAKVRGLEAEIQRLASELQAATLAPGPHTPRESCARDRQHPAHRWMLGRVLYQCPGVNQEDEDA